MHEANLLRDVGIAIVVAALVAVPFYLLRLPLMLAYLVAGVILGPHLGCRIIDSAESIATLSEIGLILLMFILGLELDLRKLLRAGKAVIVNGITQFVGCALLAALFFGLLGYRNGGGLHELTYLAVAVSLSSTLIVVKILSDRMELDTLTSRISLGILVLQDLWAIAFLAVQPNIAHLQASVLAASVGRAVALLAVAFAAARYLLPVVFARAAKLPELLLVLAMGWCFALCGLAEWLHLSLEMGALVAGVSIASFPYQADVASKVSGTRDFFITLFFVALGLKIPVPSHSALWLTAALVAFLLASRVLTVFPVLYLMKYGNRASLIPAINLSQLSEFSLVLAALGVSYGHIRNDLLSALILAMAITALISAFAIPGSDRLYRACAWLFPLLRLKDHVAGVTTVETPRHEHPRIVLLGLCREGSSLLRELLSRHAGGIAQRLLVVDFNPEVHRKLTAQGVPCVYGDLSHVDTLQHLHLDRAKVLICTLPDQQLKGTTNLKLLGFLKRLAPEAKVIVTAETLASAREMYQEGAAYVFTPRVLAAEHLADVLDQMLRGGDGGMAAAAQRALKDREEVIP